MTVVSTLKYDVVSTLKSDVFSTVKSDVVSTLKSDVLSTLKSDVLSTLKYDVLSTLKYDVVSTLIYDCFNVMFKASCNPQLSIRFGFHLEKSRYSPCRVALEFILWVYLQHGSVLHKCIEHIGLSVYYIQIFSVMLEIINKLKERVTMKNFKVQDLTPTLYIR